MIDIVAMMLKERLLNEEDIEIFSEEEAPQRVSLSKLLDEGVLTLEAVQNYLVQKIREGVISLEELEKSEAIDPAPVLEAAARELHIRYIDLDTVDLEMPLLDRVPYGQLIKYGALPVEESDTDILIAFSDLLDMAARDAMQRLFPKKPISVAVAKPSQIKKRLLQLELTENLRGLVAEIREDLKRMGGEDQNRESSAVMKLIEIIVQSAIETRASDIHIEATEKNCVVRTRIDGMLRQSFVFDKDIFAPLSSRIKLLSNMDIAEKRKPQDGRFSRRISGGAFDFRVSSVPAFFGESIVMRILDKTKVLMKLEDLGMHPERYKKFFTSITLPYGIVLVTGPTGSGKTTTLYGALNAIKDVRDKIITVEDPVEYQINGIQQVQVNTHAGLGFADALRAILRQDPDKIMVGEIRDHETLGIAIQAALTGHLVLSTLHTNDAISAIDRMRDMGIESYLLSGAVVCVQAQRLVRKICPHCKKEYTPVKKMFTDIETYLPEHAVFYRGEGCRKCQQTGYIGREMISEVLPVTEALARMIAAGATKDELSREAAGEGFVTMFEDGIKKALSGVTTLEEVYRVARLQ